MFEKDTIQTNTGDLEITFIGHGTLMLTFNEKILHIDPWSQFTDIRTILVKPILPGLKSC